VDDAKAGFKNYVAVQRFLSENARKIKVVNDTATVIGLAQGVTALAKRGILRLVAGQRVFVSAASEMIASTAVRVEAAENGGLRLLNASLYGVNIQTRCCAYGYWVKLG
jgi:hypothetical protein